MIEDLSKESVAKCAENLKVFYEKEKRIENIGIRLLR